MSHYHVLFGTPGYLPDGNETFREKQDAHDHMAREAEVVADIHEGWFVHGSVKEGRLTFSEGSPTSLPRVLEVVECKEPACEAEMEVDW